ncbi:hypothetical protein C8R44DRAFT_740006 [Mycena epipterygia]|nr:hypothetical protein C8R44DRAFT_740006 [Mycena epipterygia]
MWACKMQFSFQAIHIGNADMQLYIEKNLAQKGVCKKGVIARQTSEDSDLGAGEMGKTSLARALVHHPKIIDEYNQHRFFVFCDGIFTTIELAGLIGSHVGLKPGKDLTRAVVHHFLTSPPSLLILDNLETLWEQIESCGAIEEFLSLITDISHLALIVTQSEDINLDYNVRGRKTWQKVAWQTFIDIADNVHDSQDIEKLLLLTDNMLLAIDLMAHLVDYEGCSNVLSC